MGNIDHMKTLLVACGLVLSQPRAGAIETYTAFNHQPFPPTATEKAVRKGISKYWDSSREAKTWLTIEFIVADDGKLYEPLISHYSGDDQYDAECIEAVCASFPVSSIECGAGSVSLKHFFESFGKECHQSMYKPSYDGADIRDYLRSHPQPTDPQERFVVTHKVPLSVMDRYPGLFSKDELLSKENLVQMRVGNPDLPDKDGQRGRTMYASRIPVYYSYFEHLFKENSNVTRDAILQCASVAAAVVKP